MKRPAGMMVASYAAGILLAATIKPALALVLLGVLPACLLLWLPRRFRPYFFLPLLAGMGMANFCWRTQPASVHDLRLVLGTNEMIATVRGSLAETPREKLIENRHSNAERSTARVTASEIKLKDQWQPAVGEIAVTTSGVLASNYCAGQAVEVTGILTPPPPPLAEGLFDYRDYLATRGIFYELRTNGTNDWSLAEPIRTRLPLADRFLRWSRGTMAYGLPTEDEPLRLLWAMTLGWRASFNNEISEPFLRAGTLHLFAIDGLRIALVSGIIITLLRVLGCSRAWAGAVIIPLIWFYTAATGWGSPAIRASIMMTIVIGGWALERPSDLLNSLATAALVILLWDPRQLFEAGFQLSFFVVLVIAVMLPVLQKRIDSRLQYDPFLPKQLLSPWQVRRQAWTRGLADFAALSFTAWVASVPLGAKYFHLISPVSTLANIFAVPLGTLALTANLASLICGGWFPWATACFNHAAWFLMGAMTWVSRVSSHLPAAYFYVPEPSWWTIIVYYLTVLFLFSGWLTTRARWQWFATATVIGLAVPLANVIQSSWETQLTILPLNGGQSLVLDAPGRAHDWVIDCGDEPSAKSILIPFLEAQGFNRLSRLALTEGRLRNYGGTVPLGEVFKIKELWTSHARFRSAGYRDTLAAFETPVSRHRFFETDPDPDGWQPLHPAADDNFPHADDETLVLRGDIQGTKVLILSNLGRSGQSALLARTNDLSADIVITGLPDGGEPLNDELINASHPKLIIINDSESPIIHHNRAQLHDRLEKYGIPVIYTRESGAVTITFKHNGWKIRTMK
jgi:competence protein ComEC